MAQNAVEAVVETLHASLGDDLLAVYLFGSLSDGTYQAGQSDVNLLAIISNQDSIHRIRNTLRGEIWSAYGDILKHTPIFATPDALARHLAINPWLQLHLLRSGDLIYGDAFNFRTEIVSSDAEKLANIGSQVITASAALAPSLLPEKEANEALASLRSLARRLFGWPVDADESSAVLAGRVIGHVRKRILEESLDDWVDTAIPNAPPLIADLRAIYETDNHLILVMPDLEPVELARRIASTDWHQVAGRITDQFRALHIATPSLLRLVVRFENSAEYLVQSYHHAWGADPIGNVDIPLAHAFRGLARLPSALEIAGLPHAYITAEDADLSMLIHDFQNKLLNIQLRSELLCRTLDIPASIPEDALPDRDSPANVRIDGILQHLGWWADHYAELQQTEGEVRL